MPEITGPQVLIRNSYENELANALPLTYSKIRELRNDPTVRLIRTLALAPALASSWSIEQESSAPDGAQQFINDQIQPMRGHLLQTGLLGCFDYGWQAYEKIFTTTQESLVIIKRLKQLLPDYTRILIDPETGAYAGLRVTDFYNLESDIPVSETLLVNINVEGTNWYGESQVALADDIVTNWNAVNNSAKRHDEKIAGAHWVITYPVGSSAVNGVKKDNFEIAQDMLSSLTASGSIIVPRNVQGRINDLNDLSDEDSAWKVELLSASGGGTGYAERLRYYDNLKVRIFGFPERSVLEGQFGTKAEAGEHGSFALTSVMARHASLVQQINWHLVNQLLRYNYGYQAENTVYIEPAPLDNTQLKTLRDIFASILRSPEGTLEVLDAIDIEALQDALGIPVRATVDHELYESEVQNNG